MSIKSKVVTILLPVALLAHVAAWADTYPLTSQYWDGTYKVCVYSNGSTLNYPKPDSVCPATIIVAGPGGPTR